MPRIGFQSRVVHVYPTCLLCSTVNFKNSLYNNCFEEHIDTTYKPDNTTHIQNKIYHFLTSFFFLGLLNLGRVSVLHAENPWGQCVQHVSDLSHCFCSAGLRSIFYNNMSKARGKIIFSTYLLCGNINKFKKTRIVV